MLDINNICRICLREEYPKLPLFTEDDEGSESKPSIPEKIMSFAQVKVVKDDGLPMYICVKCYCQVDTTVEFKRLCEESFHYFQRQHDIFSNLKDISPSVQDDKENFDGQHHILPEDCIKVQEYELEGELPTQVFRNMGCDDSLINTDEGEFNASLIKCERLLDYPDIEFDLSNVIIENGSDNRSDEEHMNALDIRSEDFQDAKALFYKGSMSTSNIDKPCKCRSCEMVFSNRREMGFHISFAHRRCSLCAKYFYSNKDKDKHVCNLVIETSTDDVDQYCHLCNTSVKQIKSHMAWHSKNRAEVADRSKETNTKKNGSVMPMQINPTIEMTEAQIKCSLCNVVCLNEKCFKVHLKCMHSGHRLIYPCFMCKSRKFFSKVNCIKHLTKKHGITANENIQFELGQVKSERNAKGRQQRKCKKNHYKSKKKFKSITQRLKQTEDNDLKKRVSERKKLKEQKMAVNYGKCLKQSHPPFSHTPPIIRNNFDLTSDHKGVKRYVCRGCEVIYDGYGAAFNHYSTYSKFYAVCRIDTTGRVRYKSFLECLGLMRTVANAAAPTETNKKKQGDLPILSSESARANSIP